MSFTRELVEQVFNSAKLRKLIRQKAEEGLLCPLNAVRTILLLARVFLRWLSFLPDHQGS